MEKNKVKCCGFAFLAVIFMIFYSPQTEGMKFPTKKKIILITMASPPGPIGKVRLQGPASGVVYRFLRKPLLVNIGRRTGKLILKRTLDHREAAQFNNTQLVIQATKTSGRPQVATITIIIIILPDYYGDFFSEEIYHKVKALVKSNHILRTRHGKKRTVTALVLLRLLRRLPERAKDISKSQVKLEKTIEMTKELILKYFAKLFGKDTAVSGCLHNDHLFSKKMMEHMESEEECRNTTMAQTCSPKSRFRTFDGTCNNLKRRNLGASDRAFTRLLPAKYFDCDGLNDPIGYPNQPSAPDVPSPFLVSRDFIKDEVAAKSSPTLTHAVMQFGQFVDHDLDLAVDSEGGDDCSDENVVKCDGSPSDFRAPCFPILPLPNSNGNCIRATRSAAVCKVKGRPKKREQINVNTAYLDASQIYGSTKRVSDALRELNSEEGLLRTSPGPGNTKLLPLDASNEELCRDLGACFIAGDARSNEQQALAAFHTLFLREHNRMAKELKKINGHWSGERIYQETRRIMGAVWQKMVFYDYLPLILGPKPLPPYKGYKRKVNAGVSNEFATAAYRFGHSTIRPAFDLLDKNFDPIAPPVDLRFMFFNNTIIQRIGVESLLLGLLGNFSEEVDRTLSPGIVNHLFERENSPAQNLAALNIHRSRDHGLRGYNAYRKYCKMTSAKTFEDTKEEITDPENRKILARLYNDDPNLAELWVAGLAETPVRRASVGRTFQCVIRDQFRRARDGDRFYYKRPGVFTKAELTQIYRTSLSRFYCDNLKGIVSIQRNAFLAPTKRQPRVSCERIPGIDLCIWKAAEYFLRPCLHGVPRTTGRGKNRRCKCKCARKWGGNRCERKPAEQAVPWHATILSRGKVKCSGALVSSRHVLTTRACAEGAKVVRLGDYRSHKKDPGERTIRIWDIKKTSDIALIFFKKPVRASRAITPIRISRFAPTGKIKSHLSCWGGGRFLLKFELIVKHQSLCRTFFTSYKNFKNICTAKASFPVLTTKLTGSPLVQKRGCGLSLIGLLNGIEKVSSIKDSRFASYINPSRYQWIKKYVKF